MAYRDDHLLDSVSKAKQAFGTKCSKFLGSVTVELLRMALFDSGINVSARDVFIRGVPIEIDLIVSKPDVSPFAGLLYEPSDVLAAFEVKNTGLFGESSLKSIRRAFSLIKKAQSDIYCVYVTLAERKNYKWAANKDNLGVDVFTLFWHNGSEKHRRYESTGDWYRLIKKLISLKTNK